MKIRIAFLSALLLVAIPAQATTQIFFKQQFSSASGFTADFYASLKRSVLALSTAVTNSAASGTNIPMTKTAAGAAVAFISPPVATTITTSTGTFSATVWAKESNASCNCTWRITVVDQNTSCTVIDISSTTELTTTMASSTKTGAQSACTLTAGDRLLITPRVTNVGTMATGFNVTMDFAGPTAAANGDTSVTLADTISFQSEAEFIQDALTCVDGSVFQTVSINLPGSTLAGNTLITFATTVGSDTLTVADNTSDTFTGLAANPMLWAASTQNDYVWIAGNVTGGSPTFTVTKSANDSNVTCVGADEYAGLATSPLDVTGTMNSGTGTAMSANATPTVNFKNELVLAYENDGGSSFTPGTGFISRRPGTEGLVVEDESVFNASLTTYTPTGTLSPSEAWMMVAFTLKWATQPTAANAVMPPVIFGEFFPRAKL